MMNETDIRKYAGMLQEFGLTGIEITEGNKTVRLERELNAAMAAEAVSTVFPVSAASDVSKEQDYVSVKSPVVGVFYAAPAENADPYVAVGDYVKQGQTLCIIEAMKLMNEITAEEDGIVAEICVTNDQVVEYGTELFKIKRQV